MLKIISPFEPAHEKKKKKKKKKDFMVFRFVSLQIHMSNPLFRRNKRLFVCCFFFFFFLFFFFFSFSFSFSFFFFFLLLLLLLLLLFILKLSQGLYFMSANSECSGETALMHWLA